VSVLLSSSSLTATNYLRSQNGKISKSRARNTTKSKKNGKSDTRSGWRAVNLHPLAAGAPVVRDSIARRAFRIGARRMWVMMAGRIMALAMSMMIRMQLTTSCRRRRGMGGGRPERCQSLTTLLSLSPSRLQLAINLRLHDKDITNTRLGRQIACLPACLPH
jgi:hypothetical protein